MVNCSFIMVVQFLKIFDQIMNPLRIEKLSGINHQDLLIGARSTYFADDLGRFRVIDCFQVLLHCRIIVALSMQIVPILAEDGITLSNVDTSFLREIDSQDV